MKAEDLMIGDWVNLYGSPIKINIDDLGVIDRDETYDKGTHCKPIPLTEEILEQSGFASVEDQYDHKKYFLLGKNIKARQWISRRKNSHPHIKNGSMPENLYVCLKNKTIQKKQ